MFDIFFGWRKASKCKRLIKKVQRRLELLKNKRSCIIRQLRDDLSELLRNGHYQIVIDRVEQLSLDERKVAVYDLLENYCEFITINLQYIRRHKDCPNDINEAVSSLIFASARLGDLPELVAIRKFFCERYGQRFEKSALQLLPGNLVSQQIMDYVCINSVSEEEKYRLVDEIARSCFQQGPLLLEYRRESQDEMVNETSIPAADDYKEETEGNIVCVDYLSKRNKLLKNLSDSHHKPLPTENSTCFPTTNTCKDSVRKERVLDSERVTGREKGNISALNSGQNVEIRAAESSTEESAELPEQIIYLDDLQDQRLFTFKDPFIPLRLKIDTGSKFEDIEETIVPQKAKERLKSSRKNNTISGKRRRKKSVSVMSEDTDSTIYYGDLRESSPDSKPKRQNRKRSSRKCSIEESQKPSSTFAHDSKDQPCYIKFKSTMTYVKCIDDHSRSTCSSRCNVPMENQCYRGSTFRVPRRRVKATEDFSKCKCSCSQDQHIIEGQLHQNVESMRDHSEKPDTEEVWEIQETCNSTSRKENQGPYLRAMTMPIERPKDSITDNFIRSNSFPVEERGNGSPVNRHVHPKLPDYDEISARFLALKKEKLQKKG